MARQKLAQKSAPSTGEETRSYRNVIRSDLQYIIDDNRIIIRRATLYGFLGFGGEGGGLQVGERPGFGGFTEIEHNKNMV